MKHLRSQTDFSVIAHLGLFLDICNSGAGLPQHKLKTMEKVAYLEQGAKQYFIKIKPLGKQQIS